MERLVFSLLSGAFLKKMVAQDDEKKAHFCSSYNLKSSPNDAGHLW